MMREVLVLCEGQTEREFCRSVLAPAVVADGIELRATLVGRPQRKRGGGAPWPVYRDELLRLARERRDRHMGLLVDYYRMPHSWPGRAEAAEQPIDERGHHVERALRDDLSEDLGRRFHPCVQQHEFESLLFVKPEASALSIAIGSGREDHEAIARQMRNMTDDCSGRVERIDDGPGTAPSKRLASLVPGYDKVAWGVTAAKDIGLPDLRRGCRWLERWLEAFGAASCA